VEEVKNLVAEIVEKVEPFGWRLRAALAMARANMAEG